MTSEPHGRAIPAVLKTNVDAIDLELEVVDDLGDELSNDRVVLLLVEGLLLALGAVVDCLADA